MNFLYLYPCYDTARQAFYDKAKALSGVEAAYVSDLTIKTASDSHVFRYVPIKVHVDLERLGFQSGIIELNGLIEHLIDKVKNELVFLNNYVVKAQALEYELRERGRGNTATQVQVQITAPAGGTADDGSLELGTKITSRSAILPSGSDI
jgi:hypothetical protein